MTKEQEKMFVQQGDVVLVQGVVDKAHKSGDLLVWFKTESGGNSYAWIGKEYVGKTWAVAPEKPKYDPCRLFKKGDKVEYSPRDGRDCLEAPWIYDEAEVIEDEDKNGSVVVRFTFNYGEPAVHKVPWYYLQLVSPVEELEPYRIFENSHCFEVRRKEPDDDRGTGYDRDVSIFFFSHPPYTRTKEAARAAAEAECARLNAEHRKEQNND